MVIRVDGSVTTGWGLPRDLKVHRNTAEMMPWLKPYLIGKWNDEGEQAITRAALSGRILSRQPRVAPLPGSFSSNAETLSEAWPLRSARPIRWYRLPPIMCGLAQDRLACLAP